MSKHHHNKTQDKVAATETTTQAATNTQNQESQQVPTENKTGAAVGDLPPGQKDVTALVVKETQELDMPENASARTRLSILFNNLGAKEHRKNIEMMEDRPTTEQLMTVVDNLPAALRSGMMNIIRKANPRKPGMHTVNTGFTPIEMKLNQGVGRDQVRPKNSIPGEFYTGDSRVVGEKFDGLIVAAFQGRTLWPERDSSGGSDNQNKAPLCVSFDRITGSKYGQCDSCYYAPRPYTQGGCALDVTVVFVDREMTGLYVLKFTKSSNSLGEGLIRVLRKLDKPWARWVQFESQERTQGDKRWFVVKAMPVSDPKSRDREIPPPELDPLCGTLSAIVDYDIYYPGVLETYTRLKNAGAAEQPAEGEQVNEALLMGTKPVGENPDFSDV